MKRVAVFSLARFPFVGGAEIAVKEIASRLPDFDFHIFSHDFEKYGHGKLAKFFYIFRAWRAAEKAHKEKPFTAIWSIMAAYAGIAALLFKLRHPSIPLLLTLQEGDSEEHILKRVGVFYPIWRIIFKKADRIQVISNYLADFARRHGARCPIDVVPNGVDTARYNPNDTNRYPNVPNRSDNSNKSSHYSDCVIITTSRLVHKNGVDVLIRAMAVIASGAKQSPGDRHGLRSRDDIKLQILGAGPDEQKLKQLAKDLKIEDKVEFLGHVDPEKIPEYLARADIFVRPSRSEGLGNSFLEAMAAGLPVIGTKVGGIPDFLINHNPNDTNENPNYPNGLFVEVDNPEDLAEKITMLLENEELRKKLGSNGRKLVLENYSWDSISQKMKAIFQQLEIPRLLIATGIYPPDIGGPATYTVLLEKELPKRGFKVSVLPFGVVRHLPRVVRHFVYFLKCVRMLKTNDFIYAQDPVSVGLPAMLAAKLRGKKFFIRVAGDYAWEQSAQRFGVKDSIDEFQRNKYGWRTELLRKIQKWVVGKADLVITPSKYFQKLVGGWVKKPERVKVIYNGIALEHNPNNTNEYPNATNRSDNSDRSSQHSDYGSKTILSAGRLVPWKGLDVLIEIMKDLPDWRLIIVGDGPEREKLESRIMNYELGKRVKLLGQIPRDELLQHLAGADVFVLNTSFESFSFQVVEAMNIGTPVITTRIGNLEEIITDAKEGVLVEPNNKEQILGAIKRINSDNNFKKMIVQNARKKAEQFSIDRTVDNLVNLLNGHTG
jgi:glycosyltransferase involved in cell wall biosynthesis